MLVPSGKKDCAERAAIDLLVARSAHLVLAERRWFAGSADGSFGR
jgi:hypothetical protein